MKMTSSLWKDRYSHLTLLSGYYKIGKYYVNERDIQSRASPENTFIMVIGASDLSESLIRFGRSKELVESDTSKTIYVENITSIESSTTDQLLLSVFYEIKSELRIWFKDPDEVCKWSDVLHDLMRQQKDRQRCMHFIQCKKKSIHIPVSTAQPPLSAWQGPLATGQWQADFHKSNSDWRASAYIKQSPYGGLMAIWDHSISEVKREAVKYKKPMCQTGPAFGVRVKETAASVMCKIETSKGYELVVGTEVLALKEPHHNIILWQWPIKFVRRFGSSKTSFTLEAGRKCESGPGLFEFYSNHGKQIHAEISARIQKLSKSKITPEGFPVKAELPVPHLAAQGHSEQIYSRVYEHMVPIHKKWKLEQPYKNSERTDDCDQTLMISEVAQPNYLTRCPSQTSSTQAMAGYLDMSGCTVTEVAAVAANRAVPPVTSPKPEPNSQCFTNNNHLASSLKSLQVTDRPYENHKPNKDHVPDETKENFQKKDM